MYKFYEIKDKEYYEVKKQLERLEQSAELASRLPDGGAKYMAYLETVRAREASLRLAIVEREEHERKARIAEKRRLKREKEAKKREDKEAAYKEMLALRKEYENVRVELTRMEQSVEWASTLPDGGEEFMTLLDRLQARESSLVLSIMEREEREKEIEEKERSEREGALKEKCALNFIRDGYFK